LVKPLAAPALLLSVLLLWFRPAGIPTGAVLVGIGLQLVPLVATVLVELQLQGQLAAGGPVPSVVASLVSTDLIFRVLPIVGSAALLLWMTAAANRAVVQAGDGGKL
jgi:hypothetical protein